MAKLVAKTCCMIPCNKSTSKYYCAFVGNVIVFKLVSVMIVKEMSASEMSDSKIICMFLMFCGNQSAG